MLCANLLGSYRALRLIAGCFPRHGNDFQNLRERLDITLIAALLAACTANLIRIHTGARTRDLRRDRPDFSQQYQCRVNTLPVLKGPVDAKSISTHLFTTRIELVYTVLQF
jgi:hypothetical protein